MFQSPSKISDFLNEVFNEGNQKDKELLDNF